MVQRKRTGDAFGDLFADTVKEMKAGGDPAAAAATPSAAGPARTPSRGSFTPAPLAGPGGDPFGGLGGLGVSTPAPAAASVDPWDAPPAAAAGGGGSGAAAAVGDVGDFFSGLGLGTPAPAPAPAPGGVGDLLGGASAAAAAGGALPAAGAAPLAAAAPSPAVAPEPAAGSLQDQIYGLGAQVGGGGLDDLLGGSQPASFASHGSYGSLGSGGFGGVPSAAASDGPGSADPGLDLLGMLGGGGPAPATPVPVPGASAADDGLDGLESFLGGSQPGSFSSASHLDTPGSSQQDLPGAAAGGGSSLGLDVGAEFPSSPVLVATGDPLEAEEVPEWIRREQKAEAVSGMQVLDMPDELFAPTGGESGKKVSRKERLDKMAKTANKMGNQMSKMFSKVKSQAKKLGEQMAEAMKEEFGDASSSPPKGAERPAAVQRTPSSAGSRGSRQAARPPRPMAPTSASSQESFRSGGSASRSLPDPLIGLADEALGTAPKDPFANAKYDDYGNLRKPVSPPQPTAPVSREDEAKRAQLKAERLQREAVRVAEAVAEKQEAEMKEQFEEVERQEARAMHEADLKAWENKNKGNIRSMLCALDSVLWEGSGVKTPGLMDVVEAAGVKKAYRKVIIKVHPDKVIARGGTPEQRYIASFVYDVLNRAFAEFSGEEL